MSTKQMTPSTTLSNFIDVLRTSYENDKDEWLSPSRVATELGMHINTIYKIIQKGELVTYNLIVGNNGRAYYRIRRSDLQDWLESRRMKYRTKKSI